jgi:acyl-CoA thioesterase
MMNELELARRCAEKMYARDKASQAMGIEVSVPAPGGAVATMTVRDDMLNGFDICHGGLVCALADTAFAFACNAYDQVTVAAGANVDFVRPALRGDRLTAVASEDYRGKKTGFYTIRISNQRQELVAVFRGRSASRAEKLL